MVNPDIATLKPLGTQYGPYAPGRPAYYADFSVTPDKGLKCIDAFHKVMVTLSCRERYALARTLGVDESTVRRWKELKTLPNNIDVIFAIIEWGRAGKPLVTRKRRRNDFTMF